MMKIYLLSILLTITGLSQAANLITPELQKQLNEDVALVHSIKQLSQSKGTGGYLSVGADNQCAYSTIQSALNALALTGVYEIRIARNKSYNENLIIDDMDVSIIGGYLDCFNMGLPNAIGGPSNNQSIINGGDNDSVVKIQNTTQRRTISLKNLRLIDGNSIGPGGGLLVMVVDSMLSLVNLDILNNNAHYGAGIAIIAGDTDMVLENSRVFNNVARYGGGLYCSGNNSSVLLLDESGISANRANGIGVSGGFGNGGGVHLKDCQFSMYSGSADGGLAGISSNFASGNGGGIYSDDGYVIIHGNMSCNEDTCIGDNTNPANISNNTAGFITGIGSGGGIFTNHSLIILQV